MSDEFCLLKNKSREVSVSDGEIFVTVFHPTRFYQERLYIGDDKHFALALSKGTC